MDTKRSYISKRIAIVSICITVVMVCSVFGSFAKYTASGSGSSTAQVANWSFNVGDANLAAGSSVAFNLFSTVNDTSGTKAETDVARGKIAPGTSGRFDLRMSNNSDVTAKYTLSMTETNSSNIPLQYSVDGKNWKDSIAELDLARDKVLTVGSSDTVTVSWRWVFEGTTDGAHKGQTDSSDTALGKASGSKNVTVGVTVNASQVD